MSEALYISGVSYHPANSVAKRFGYTSTYILLLAREGKIDGKKIGTRWYIDPKSVEAFFSNAQKVQEVRSEQIRVMRKEELRTHKKARKETTHSKALVETLAVLVIGLSIGTVGYLGTTPQTASVAQSGSFFERIATSLYSFFAPQNTDTVQEVTVTNTATTSVPAVTVGTTTRTSLVIAPDEVMTTTTVQNIKDSLSDDVSVSVNPNNPDTGVIIPHFAHKDGETYRYLMVPISPPHQ